jgi:small subunit ribosomal protein S1
MTPDPYIGVENKYKVGEIYEVKISKLTDFGAFAELRCRNCRINSYI